MSETASARLPSRRLPARYAGIVMPFVLSVIMTFIISGVATMRALGPTAEFLATWPTSWLLSWVIAFPVLLVVLPIVRRIVALLVEPPRH